MVEPSQGMELEMKHAPMLGRESFTIAPHSEEGTGQQSAGRPKVFGFFKRVLHYSLITSPVRLNSL